MRLAVTPRRPSPVTSQRVLQRVRFLTVTQDAKGPLSTHQETVPDTKRGRNPDTAARADKRLSNASRRY